MGSADAGSHTHGDSSHDVTADRLRQLRTQLFEPQATARRGDADNISVDAALITKPSDVRWLTGFTGTSASVYVTPTDVMLLTDGRYIERAAEDAPNWPATTDRRDVWLQANHGSDQAIGVQGHHLTWAQVRALDAAKRKPEVDGEGFGEIPDESASDGGPLVGPVVDIGTVITNLRMIKDETEIALLRQACAITTQVITNTYMWLEPGLTEAEIARRIVDEMVELGAEGPSFPPIVAAGVNSSRPHHAATSYRLQSGDFVTMDIGAQVSGYAADMTRVVALGAGGASDVDAQLGSIHGVVVAAQAAGREAVADGVHTSAVDSACRDFITDAGWGDEFVHGTGHGVGLDIHEEPYLGAKTKKVLAAGMTVTVEPGVYVAGRGGIRIEDTVLVTADGHEILTPADHDLIVL